MRTELDIFSKIDNLSYVEKMIDDIASDFKLTSEVYGNILVATIEAVNNAIIHGNKLDGSKKVNIKFNVENDKLQISIKDDGIGFDYEHIPDPTAPENIEKPHGRGIFLMKHLVDELEFKNNGSEVEFLFKLK